MRRLLVLRPEPGASATLERASRLGFDVFSVPLFEVEPLDWAAPDPSSFDALLLTSANAVFQAGKKLEAFRGLSVCAVGEAMANAARAHGFAVETTGKVLWKNSSNGSIGEKSFFILCAKHRHSSPSSHTIFEVEVYQALAIDCPDLSQAQGCVALIHSPRAARRFAELIDVRGSIAIAAISRAAAQASQSGWAALEFASEPSDEGLLA